MYLEELINWWLQIIPEKDNLIVFNYATYPSYLNKLSQGHLGEPLLHELG